MIYICVQHKTARAVSAFWQSMASIPNTSSSTQCISQL